MNAQDLLSLAEQISLENVQDRESAAALVRWAAAVICHLLDYTQHQQQAADDEVDGDYDLADEESGIAKDALKKAVDLLCGK